MPVRERRRRRHVLELTRQRALALEIGPTPDDLRADPVERLREVWLEHRASFGPRSWAVQFWEFAHDIRLDDVYEPAASAGCPGVGL